MKMPGWDGRLSAVRMRSFAEMLVEPLADILDAKPVEFDTERQ